MRSRPTPGTTSPPLALADLLALERLVGAAVVAVMLAAALPAAAPLVVKARQVGPLLEVTTVDRTAAAERLALTGSPVPAASAAVGAGGPATPDQPYTYRRQGPLVIAIGRVSPMHSGAFLLAFGPAWDERALGWHLLWMCGSHAPPAGWQQPARPPPEGLAADEVLHACRS